MLHQERRGHVNTIVKEQFNSILFHKFGPIKSSIPINHESTAIVYYYRYKTLVTRSLLWNARFCFRTHSLLRITLSPPSTPSVPLCLSGDTFRNRSLSSMSNPRTLIDKFSLLMWVLMLAVCTFLFKHKYFLFTAWKEKVPKCG